jgi:hypothetical protein
MKADVWTKPQRNEQAKAELKTLMSQDAKEAIGHG